MTISRRLLLKGASLASLISMMPSSVRAAAKRPSGVFMNEAADEKLVVKRLKDMFRT